MVLSSMAAISPTVFPLLLSMRLYPTSSAQETFISSSSANERGKYTSHPVNSLARS